VQIHDDRLVVKQDFRTDIGSGSFFVNRNLAFTGRGVTVAVLDSGVNAAHDDLRRRVVGFVDFVNGQTQPYDDNGHGTHIAGIIAGSGRDSGGKEAGVAPGANIFSVKVLDANGQSHVSTVLAALDWLAANAQRYGIRVVNISFAAAVRESYDTDPLTLAVKKLVDQGIIVVAAAGNWGTYAGKEAFGFIGAPGNAPWVITVGAASSLGTLTRGDDTVANFSSHGPTRFNHHAKPDIVAGGVGIVSTSAPGSTNYIAHPEFLLAGIVPGPFLPYEVMTGTSMATPAVTGTIAAMLEANPQLTPNLAKGILEYTAEARQYRALEQGAGFLNSLGAVRLSGYLAGHSANDAMPVEAIWSQHLNWGNHEYSGGVISADANAWSTSVTWGDRTVQGSDGNDNIIWGTDAGNDNIIWGTDASSDNIIWGTTPVLNGINAGTYAGPSSLIVGTDAGPDNIIWGTDAGPISINSGGDAGLNSISSGPDVGPDNIIWGTFDGPLGRADSPDSYGNPSFLWFLDRRNDRRWVVREFADPWPLY
jgi:serine protease AprX